MPLLTTGAGSFPAIGGGSFAPSDLSGLIVWLKADTGVTLSGANVNGWTDQVSSIAFTPTIPGTTSPQFSATGFNTSFPGISFSGSTSQHALYSTASAVVFGNANNLATISAVVNISSSAGNAKALYGYLATGDATETAGAHSVNIRNVSGPSMQVVHSSGQVISSAYTGSTNIRMLWEFDGTNLTSYFNNVQQSQAASNFTLGASGSGNGGLSIGALNTDATVCLQFTIAEVVITKTAISSGNRTSLDNYFKSKWGL